MGICADKDLLRCLPLILSICPLSHIHCVSARHPRALEAHQLMRKLSDASHRLDHKDNDADAHVLSRDDRDCICEIKETRGALRDAINICGENMIKDDKLVAVVVVFGTAFIMAEIRAELGIIEARDAAILSKCDFSTCKDGKFYADVQENFDGTT